MTQIFGFPLKSSGRRQTIATLLRLIIAILLRKHSSQPFRAQAPLADQNSGGAIAEPATSFLLRRKAWLEVELPLAKGRRRDSKKSLRKRGTGVSKKLPLAKGRRRDSKKTSCPQLWVVSVVSWFYEGGSQKPPYRKPIVKKKKIDQKICLNQRKSVILQRDKDTLLRTFVNKNEI